jgi:hypothetical protein
MEKSVRHWSLVKRAAELSMIISYIFRSTYNNEIFICGMFAFVWFTVSKLPNMLKSNIEKPAVYVTLLMLFMSQATFIAQVAGAVMSVVVVYEPITKFIDVENLEKTEESLRYHFNVRLSKIYLFFIIEWTLTRLDEWGLVLTLLAGAAFNAYVYFVLSKNKVDIASYRDVNKLPPMYPIPLDVKDAAKYCSIAKEVFKEHYI